MEPLIVEIKDRLAEVGDVFSVQGHIAQDAYTLGDHNFILPAGIDYDIVLTNAGEGILATGMVHADVIGECDRCLEEAHFHIAGEVDGYFLFDEASVDTSEDDSSDFDYYLVENESINLAEPMMCALVMETPFVVLCKNECKGLCSVCGTNLNEEDCGHAQQIELERLNNSPFAALSQLDIPPQD